MNTMQPRQYSMNVLHVFATVRPIILHTTVFVIYKQLQMQFHQEH